MKTSEKEKIKYSFYGRIKYLLNAVFNVNGENKGKLAATIAKGIIFFLFILLAVMFMLKTTIDCIAGRADIGTVLISFLVFTAINFFLRIMTYNNERNRL